MYVEIKDLAHEAGVTEQIPRRTGRQTHRDNVQATTPEQYWRITVYYAFSDHLQDELQTRLLNHDLEDRLLAENLLPQIIKGLDDNCSIIIVINVLCIISTSISRCVYCG